jgi:deferrochelatase/peroxidase EfeB
MSSPIWQAGISEPPPEHVLIAALTFAQAGPPAVAALKSLSELIRRELGADLDVIDPDSAPQLPTRDSGELGTDTEYETTDLTVTLGISSSGFAALGVTQPNLPADLFPVDWADLSDAAQNPS